MDTTGRTFRVLYADPKPTYRRRLGEAIGANFDVTTVGTVGAASRTLDPTVDCVVTAASFADGDATDLLELAAGRAVPTILFTADADPTVLSTFLRESRADVVWKRDAPEDVRPDGTLDRPSGPTGDPEIDRLLARISCVYRESIADIEETILHISSSLMGAAMDEVDTKVEWALASIGREIDADLCAVYRYDAEADAFRHTHVWDGEAGRTLPDGGSAVAVPSAHFPAFDRRISRFRTVSVPNEQPGDELPGPDHPFLRDQSISSFVAVPIVLDWTLFGALTVGSRHERPWPGDLDEHLGTAGELIASILQRRERRRDLERKNERLERFASVVGHDLQGPLQVIDGHAKHAMETGDVDRLDRVLGAADRMERLLEDLLTLAWDGEAVGEREPLELDDVVAEAWRTVDTGEATLHSRDPGTIHADPGRLRQLLENLFRNAVDHAAPDVTVTVGRTKGGFFVADDGPGIPPEDRGRVFEDGYTGNEGTGLGLSIVRTIVDGHGWRVAVTESDAGGARFVIRTDA